MDALTDLAGMLDRQMRQWDGFSFYLIRTRVEAPTYRVYEQDADHRHVANLDFCDGFVEIDGLCVDRPQRFEYANPAWIDELRQLLSFNYQDFPNE